MADGLPAGFATCVATVVDAQWITPRRRRVTLAHEAIADMEPGAGPAPAVRLLIPPARQPVHLPTVSADGLVYPHGAVPPTPRTFTIRRFDRTSASIDVDIVTGHAGVATEWAASVAAGAEVGVAGPKTFAPLPLASQYVLLGDESALPAIETLLDQPGARVAAAIEADRSHHHHLDGADWYEPDGDRPGGRLLDRLDDLVAHTADVVVWVAGETSLVREARSRLHARPQPPCHVRAAGYWRRARTSTDLDEQLLARTRELIAAGADLTELDDFALALPE